MSSRGESMPLVDGVSTVRISFLELDVPLNWIYNTCIGNKK